MCKGPGAEEILACLGNIVRERVELGEVADVARTGLCRASWSKKEQETASY